MATKNEHTGDLIKSKYSDSYADKFDAIFRNPKKMTEQELYESELDRADAKYQQEKDDET